MHSSSTLFSNAEAEALTGLQPGLLRKWANASVFRPRSRAAHRGVPECRWIRADAVALRALVLLRERAGDRIPLVSKPLRVLANAIRHDRVGPIAEHFIILRSDVSPRMVYAWVLVAPGDPAPASTFALQVDELVKRAQEDVSRALPAVIAARKAPGRPQRERTALRLAGVTA